MVLAGLYFLVLIGAAVLLALLWLAYKALTWVWQKTVLKALPKLVHDGVSYLWKT